MADFSRWIAAPARLLVVLLILMVTACDGDRPQNMTATEIGPANRIISLAPHLTELVYSVGAGDQLVGTVAFSDFPLAALELPRVGDAFRLDYEAIAELDPDLVLAWVSGTPQETIERLAQLGHRVVAIESGSLDHVADSLRQIGQLVGTETQAEAAAVAFERSLHDLRAGVADRDPVSVFYQISAQPLFTITRRHVIGEAIELCGGRNVFGRLAGISPSVSPEAVIEAAPEVIIATYYPAAEPEANPLAVWRQWTSIPAVRDDHLFLVNANLMSRPSVRILGGVRELCARIATGAAPTRAHPAPLGDSERAPQRTAGRTVGSDT